VQLPGSAGILPAFRRSGRDDRDPAAQCRRAETDVRWGLLRRNAWGDGCLPPRCGCERPGSPSATATAGPPPPASPPWPAHWR